jgi:hypothetical protein
MVLLSKNNGPDYDNSRRNKSDHWPSLRKQMTLTPFISFDVQNWMNLQTHYDIQCAEDAAGSAIQKITPRRDEALAA